MKKTLDLILMKDRRAHTGECPTSAFCVITCSGNFSAYMKSLKNQDVLKSHIHKAQFRQEILSI